MALAAVHQNIISEEQQLAEQVIDLLQRIDSLKARFNLNDTYNAVADTDAVTAVFPNLNQSKIGNGFNAFDAIKTALGDAVSGDLASLYLLKD